MLYWKPLFYGILKLKDKPNVEETRILRQDSFNVPLEGTGKTLKRLRRKKKSFELKERI